jgi:tetratricopeptide (TPR) repeat protein
MNASSLFEKGKYEKALEILNKAEELAEKAKSPDLKCRVLLHKGEVMNAMGKPREAVDLYEKALELSSRLFLRESQDSSTQSCLYNSIGLIANTIKEADNSSEAKKSYERINEYFKEIFDVYDRMIAKQPENTEYLLNYLKTLLNFTGYSSIFNKAEKQTSLINNTLETFKKILNLQPEDQEILKRLDSFSKTFGQKFLDDELFEDAKKMYGKVQEIYRSLLEKNSDNELVIHYLVFSYSYLGDLHSEQGYPEKMEEIYHQALSILENNLRKNPENAAFFMDKGKLYEEIGINYSEGGNSEKANSYYGKALANFEAMKEKFMDDLDYHFQFVEIFDNLGKLFAKINNIENAKKCYLNKIEIDKELFKKDPEDEDLGIEINETFMQIGNLYAEVENKEQAKEYYQKAIQGYEKLFSESPQATDFELYISDVLTALGDLHAKVRPEGGVPDDSEFEIAREFYEKALKITEKEYARYPEDLLCRDELVRTLSKLGDSFAAQDKYNDTIPFYRRIVEIKELAIGDDSGNWIEINTLANVLYKLGSFYAKVGDVELEKEQYLKAAKFYSKVLQDKKLQLSIRKMLAIDLQLRGIAFLKLEKYDVAEELLRLSLEFFENFYEKNSDDPENYPYIYEAFFQIVNLQKAQGNIEQAAKNLDSLLPIVEKLFNSNPEKFKALENSGIIYTRAGEVYSLNREYDKSKKAFEQNLGINKVLLEEEPGNFIYRENQAETFEKYAELLAKLGRKEEAEAYTTKSQEIYRKLAEEK